jgi:hypothetical protein
VDQESKRVSDVLLVEGGLDNPGLELLLGLRVGAVEEELGDGVRTETG